MKQTVSPQVAAMSAPQPVDRGQLLRKAASEASQPLQAGLRSTLEQQLGHDFSHVRVHAGAVSAQAAEAFGARAYTVGRDVYLGTEAHSAAGASRERLLAHEAVHTIQQGSAAVTPTESLAVSSPDEPAEREAEHLAGVALSAAPAPGAGAVRPSPVAVARLATPRIQRDLVRKRGVKDGKFDADLKAVTAADGATGLRGTIKFKPDPDAPDSTSIRLLQVVRYIDQSTGTDLSWTGGEANRNSVRTAEDKKKGIKPGWFVDHSAAAATPRTAKTDAAVSPYYRDYWPNATQSQDGSKSGKTIAEASLWDFPRSNMKRKIAFETAAKASDTGYVYATLSWGFTVNDPDANKVTGEYMWANRGPSATFGAAVKAFDEFYKNPGSSGAPT